MSCVKDTILKMLAELRPEFDYAESENFIEDGLLDSFDVISLTDMLEKAYNVSIDGMDIVPENYVSIEAIEALVRRSGAGA